MPVVGVSLVIRAESCGRLEQGNRVVAASPSFRPSTERNPLMRVESARERDTRLVLGQEPTRSQCGYLGAALVLLLDGFTIAYCAVGG